MTTDRAALRALADAATPGPWEANGNGSLISEWTHPTEGYTIEVSVARGMTDRTRDFIAAARTAVPELLDALDAETRRADDFFTVATERWHTITALRAERDEARADLRTATEQGDRYLARAKAAERQVTDVRALHVEQARASVLIELEPICVHCADLMGDDGPFYGAIWPCATIRALDGGAE